jgi:predicted NodU family carbamoyl transferase
MLTLGLSSFNHDTAAALLEDGTIKAAVVATRPFYGWRRRSLFASAVDHLFSDGHPASSQ